MISTRRALFLAAACCCALSVAPVRARAELQRTIFAAAQGHFPDLSVRFDVVTFTETGAFSGVFAPYSFNDRPVNLAADESSVYVGVFEYPFRGYHIDQYDLLGNLVAQIPSPFSPTDVPYSLELDEQSNMYLKFDGAVVRLDAMGVPNLTVTTPGNYGGADADANGNIYVSSGSVPAVLQAFDSQGTLQSTIPVGPFPSNLAIDEARSLLYLGYQAGDIEVYDIAQPQPSLMSRLTSAEVRHLNFDGLSDSLFVATVGPPGIEYGTDGTLRNVFVLPDAYAPGARTILDIIAVAVPEPGGFVGLIGLFCLRRLFVSTLRKA